MNSNDSMMVVFEATFGKCFQLLTNDRGVLVLALVLLPGALTSFTNDQFRVAHGAEVQWLQDGDGDWSEAINWTTNPNLPGPTDDVVIDVGGDVVRTITNSESSTTIRSIISEENMHILEGPFVVTNGDSLFNAELVLQRGEGRGRPSLEANGSSTSLAATGQVIAEDVSIFARDGARIELPTLSEYSGSVDYGRLSRLPVTASGTGSVLDLSGVTNVSYSSPRTRLVITASAGGLVDLSSASSMSGRVSIFASDGGLVDLRSLAEVSGSSDPVVVAASGAGGIVDISSLESWGGSSFDEVSVSGTGTIIWSDPAILNSKTVNISGEGTLSTRQLTEFVGSVMEVRGGATPDLSNIRTANNSSFFAGSSARITLPLLTDYSFGVRRSLEAQGVGSVLDLSTLSSITANGGSLTVTATNGGLADLSTLTRVDNPSVVPISMFSQGEGSILDVSSLGRLVSGTVRAGGDRFSSLTR